MQALNWGTWTLSCSMWDLVSRPAINPGPLHTLRTQRLSPWTTREVPAPFAVWVMMADGWSSLYVSWLALPSRVGNCSNLPFGIQGKGHRKGFVPWSPATESGFISLWQADYSKNQFATLKYTAQWFFSALRILYNHHPYQIPEHFHALRKKSITSTPCSLPPLSPWQPLSIFPDLPDLFISNRKLHPMKLLVMVRLFTPWKWIKCRVFFSRELVVKRLPVHPSSWDRRREELKFSDQEHCPSGAVWGTYEGVLCCHSYFRQ